MTCGLSAPMLSFVVIRENWKCEFEDLLEASKKECSDVVISEEEGDAVATIGVNLKGSQTD
jgi:hypothetical protein